MAPETEDNFDLLGIVLHYLEGGSEEFQNLFMEKFGNKVKFAALEAAADTNDMLAANNAENVARSKITDELNTLMLHPAKNMDAIRKKQAELKALIPAETTGPVEYDYKDMGNGVTIKVPKRV